MQKLKDSWLSFYQHQESWCMVMGAILPGIRPIARIVRSQVLLFRLVADIAAHPVSHRRWQNVFRKEEHVGVLGLREWEHAALD